MKCSNGSEVFKVISDIYRRNRGISSYFAKYFLLYILNFFIIFCKMRCKIFRKLTKFCLQKCCHLPNLLAAKLLEFTDTFLKMNCLKTFFCGKNPIINKMFWKTLTSFPPFPEILRLKAEPLYQEVNKQICPPT